MAKKLTSKKAKEILHDKSVHGKPLTEKQRKYFGYVASGGTPKAQATLNIQPTTADSLAVYNAQLAQNAYYDKFNNYFKKRYERFSNLSPNEFRKVWGELIRRAPSESLETLRGELQTANTPYTLSSYVDDIKKVHGVSTNEARKIIARAIDKTKQLNTNPNIVYYQDLITPAIDPAAPFSAVDYRIVPQGAIQRTPLTYNDLAFPGQNVTTLYYDPLEVKPWHMKTEEEREEWLKRHSKPKPVTKPKQTTKTTPQPVTTQQVADTTSVAKPTPKPVQTKTEINPLDYYGSLRGDAIYYPGENNGIFIKHPAGAFVGVRKNDGTIEYVAPEHYEKMAVPTYARPWIEAKVKEQKQTEKKQYGGGTPKAQASVPGGVKGAENVISTSDTAVPKVQDFEGGPFTNEQRVELAKKVVQIARQKEASNEWYQLPESYRQTEDAQSHGAYKCIYGVCGVLKDAGVINEIIASNTEFAKRAGELGFQNLGYGMKGIGNLDPGDVVQFNQSENEQGNYYPSHAMIFLGAKEGKDGKVVYEFFDNNSEAIRDYKPSRIASLLNPNLTNKQENASIFKVNPVKKQQGYPTDWDLYSKEVEKPKSYIYSILKDSPYRNILGRPRKGMQEFISFTEDEDNINELVRKLNVDKETIHDELLNVFGELGQENKFQNRIFGGDYIIENTIENIFKPKDWSVGPGQIKFSELSDELKQKFDIKSPKDLYDWKKVIPLMVGINVKNRQWMMNQGEKLSERLIGTPGVSAENLKGGVGRWTPYLYRGLPRNPKKQLRKEAEQLLDERVSPTISNYMTRSQQLEALGAKSNMSEEEREAFIQNYINTNLRRASKLREEGSYASKVFDIINENLYRRRLSGGERDVIKPEGEEEEYFTTRLPEVEVRQSVPAAVRRRNSQRAGIRLTVEGENLQRMFEEVWRQMQEERRQRQSGGEIPKAQSAVIGGIPVDLGALLEANKGAYQASDIARTVQAPMVGVLPLAEQERLQKQYEAQRFAQQKMQRQPQIKRGLSAAERAAGEEYRRAIEKRKAIANAPLTQTIAMGAPSGITEGTLQAAGEGSKLILEGTPAFSASRLINALNPNRDVYFQKDDPLWRKGLGVLGMAGDVANIFPIARPLVKSGVHALDMQFSPTGRQLRGVEQMVRELGGTDWDVAAQQMESVGITPKQRMGYFPGVSEFGSRYGYPFSYGGSGGETKLAQTFRNFRQGKDFRPGKKDYGDIAPPRSDSWRLYLGLPQKANTFELANSSPFNHPMYTPEVLKNMELFSLKNPDALSTLLPFEMTPSYGPLVKGVRFGNFLSNTPTVSVRAGEPSHYLNREAWQALNKEVTDTEGNIVMGGYNTRLNNLGFEYTDVWDLHPDFSLNSVLPNRVSNYLANNSLTRGLLTKETKQGLGTVVAPRKFKIKVENYFGKPFMSYDIFPEYNSAIHTKLLRKASLDKLRKTRLAGEGEDALEFGQQRIDDIYTPEYRRQKKYQNLGKALEDLRLNYPKRQMGGEVGKGGLGVIADTGDDIVMPQEGMVQRAQSPGYEGLGYSSKGYKYNSAWGGRWAMGGAIPKAQNSLSIPSWLNPYNWGVEDYTNKGDFNSAYAAARNEGQKEFMWNNKRYSTNMKGTLAEQLQWSGITNDRLGVQGPLERRAYQAVKPATYDDVKRNALDFLKGRNRFDGSDDAKYAKLSKDLEEAVNKKEFEKAKTILSQIKEVDYGNVEDDPYSEDAWRMYLGMPQKNSTFTISKYKPSISKDKNTINYYSLPEEFKKELLDSYNKGEIKMGVNQEWALPSTFGENKSKARVLGNFKVGKGKDDKGEYISYYDKYDLAPSVPYLGTIPVEKFVGKPFEIYDRIYLNSEKKAIGGSIPGATGMMYARTGQDWKPRNISQKGGYVSSATYMQNRLNEVKKQLGGSIPISSKGLYEYPDQEVIVPTLNGRITMKGIDHPVDAIDEYGNFKRMQPGEEYQFPGKMIKETPIKSTRQDRGQLKKLDQLLNFTNYNNG